MSRVPKKKIKGGFCHICGRKEHLSPSLMMPEDLSRHRLTENRDCPNYDACLTKAAHEDAVMVPCIYCKLVAMNITQLSQPPGGCGTMHRD